MSPGKVETERGQHPGSPAGALSEPLFQPIASMFFNSAISSLEFGGILESA